MNTSNKKSSLCVMQVLPALSSGGVERGTIDIAQALIQSRHKAIVVSSGGSMVKQLEQMGAIHIQLPVKSKSPFTLRKNAIILKKLILEHKVDIVHARSRAPAWSCYWATKNTKTPFITTFHGAYSHQNRLKHLYNSVMLKSHTTIAVSNFIAHHISQTYPSNISKLTVIHRGVNTELFKPSKQLNTRTETLRSQWSIPINKTIIMLPGRLTRLKGHTTLIKAISQLDTSNIVCLFVGEHHGNISYEQELKAAINQHNLENIIYLVGGCLDMTAAYSLSNIVVSASVKPESFGRVTCEAQAMNCLVVATNHGGTKEVLAPCQQPYLCEPNNSKAMREALIAALTTNKQEQSIIFNESRKYIEANFTLDKMCRDTLAVYQSTLKTLITENQGH
jgi:glycosyltransferase involved in cell wall biosynthesis